jgi:hypothetical protein
MGALRTIISRYPSADAGETPALPVRDPAFAILTIAAACKGRQPFCPCPRQDAGAPGMRLGLMLRLSPRALGIMGPMGLLFFAPEGRRENSPGQAKRRQPLRAARG